MHEALTITHHIPSTKVKSVFLGYTDYRLDIATRRDEYFMWKPRLSIEDMTWISNCYRCGGWPKCVYRSDPVCVIYHHEKTQHTMQDFLDVSIGHLDDDVLQKNEEAAKRVE